jgi:hypothetical protein
MGASIVVILSVLLPPLQESGLQNPVAKFAIPIS